jgi:orotidine-5'-phosphate decarboxylase
VGIDAAERLIVALDVPHRARDERQLIEGSDAFELVTMLDGLVSFFKIGWPLYMAGGQQLARDLIKLGKRVFLDLKFSDIAETVRRLVLVAAKDGVAFLTINASFDAVRAAVEARRDSALRILTITILTSLDESDIREAGMTGSVQDNVKRKTVRAVEAGCDGVIASGGEAAAIRSLVSDDFLIVTPGIRPAGSLAHDHKRAATPYDSIIGGADYLVVGRPITTANNPRQAANEIISEMQRAFDRRPGRTRS